uniref:alpha/beta hydrolase n=1 Tax=Roseateles sp. TaxID=1971397 RepID=UPI0037C505D4
MKRRGLLCAAVGAATGLPSLQAWAQPAVVPKPDATPLVLENTVAHLLTARESARVYPIWVDLPRSYGEPESARRRYPVVVAADAPWSHAYLRTIRNFVGRRGQNIEDFILVGLAPEQGLSHLDYRARDYTPSDPHRRPGKGGQHYRCDARRQVFIGHSYGSLLGLHVMLSQPELFGHYILGSPS